MSIRCPENWAAGCSCSVLALEPNDDCYMHGGPDIRQCPYCGQMRGHKACKRCGCSYGLRRYEPEGTTTVSADVANKPEAQREGG